MTKFWNLIFLVAAAPILFGQQSEMDRLVAESLRLRDLSATRAERNDDHFGKLKRPDWTHLKNLLRDWVESRLPPDIASLDAAYQGLEAQLTADLRRAGVFESRKALADAGYISRLEFSRPVENPGALMVQAGVTVPCGSDVSIYLYRFTTSGRARLLEASGASPYGNEFVDTRFSTPNASAGRVFYASWLGVQCASVWNGLEYRLFRIDPHPDRATELCSDTHSIVIGEDSKAKLTPEELLLELTAGAMEAGFRRTYVLRYSIGPEAVHRIDPVALQPQDFVHEWLIRPWSEMQSRSSPTLAKWHTLLHADYVGGEYEFVQQCKERPKITQVAVDIHTIGDREMPEPLSVYFLVRDKGEHSYQMSEVSFSRQPGCPGESQPADENPPSLFQKQ